jgi:hypothetical protein
VAVAGKLSAVLPPGTERHILTGWAEPQDLMTSYAVVIGRADDGGFGALGPDLPGCLALAGCDGTTGRSEKSKIFIPKGP